MLREPREIGNQQTYTISFSRDFGCTKFILSSYFTQYIYIY